MASGSRSQKSELRKQGGFNSIVWVDNVNINTFTTKDRFFSVSVIIGVDFRVATGPLKISNPAGAVIVPQAPQARPRN